MDANAPQFLSAAIQFTLVALAAFGIFVAVTSHLRYQELFKSSVVLERRGPVGLLETQIADRAGGIHRESPAFSLLMLQAQDREQLGNSEALAAFLREKIRGVLRRTDTLIDYGGDRFAAIVDVPLSSVPAVVGRINDGIRKEVFRPSDGQPVRVNISIGVAATPEDGHRAQLLREGAEAALVTALVGAGTVSYTSPPPRPATHTHAQADLPEDQKGLVDELTGVLKEKFLLNTLQKYVARYRNNDFPVSVICLDVDYLHRYNEQYGTRIGDMILKQIGFFLQGALREADLIGRCDGDQFVIALCATPQEALGAGQRLATAIKRMPFQMSGAPLKVAVSGGVAGYPDHGSGGRALYYDATAALHVAKSRGRSTVVMYHFDMAVEEPAQERVDVF